MKMTRDMRGRYTTYIILSVIFIWVKMWGFFDKITIEINANLDLLIKLNQ